MSNVCQIKKYKCTRSVISFLNNVGVVNGPGRAGLTHFNYLAQGHNGLGIMDY